jgi:methionine synthase I (cobalamin-dependent)
MNDKSLLQELQKTVLICDGAMGTMIQKTGVLKAGDAPELLNISHPGIISGIHRSYIEAGSCYIGSTLSEAIESSWRLMAWMAIRCGK